MDVAVTKTPDGWVARHHGLAIGKAAERVRPNGRCFVAFGACRADAYEPLVQAIADHLGCDLYTEIDEADAELLQRLVDMGFKVHRREHTYAIPTDPAITGLTKLTVPVGFELVTANRVSEDRLRELDDELRQDVPGADGWRWDRDGFRKETYDAPDFDPATYLVVIEQATGRYAGLVRVWNRPDRPRLGLIGIARPYRRRGLASLLLAQVFATLHRRGTAEVVAEVDVTNTGSNRLLTGVGAHQTGGLIELDRPWPSDALPSGKERPRAALPRPDPAPSRGPVDPAGWSPTLGGQVPVEPTSARRAMKTNSRPGRSGAWRTSSTT